MAEKYTYKGKGPVSAGYASGGPSITTRSRFMKVPDTFRTSLQKQDYDKKGKGGTLSKMEGETKVEKAIKPRS
jgi:hypothetical protein